MKWRIEVYAMLVVLAAGCGQGPVTPRTSATSTNGVATDLPASAKPEGVFDDLPPHTNGTTALAPSSEGLVLVQQTKAERTNVFVPPRPDELEDSGNHKKLSDAPATGQKSASIEENALKGDAEEQFELGRKYYIGDGRPNNYAEAFKWFSKAAEQQHAQAQAILGAMYYSGQGVATNKTEAVKWVRKAAEQGRAEAQYALGLAYASGDGVEKEQAEAVKWYRKAAEQGHVEGQFELGNIFFKGFGREQLTDGSLVIDSPEASKWYGYAAEQNHEGAQGMLGFLKLMLAIAEGGGSEKFVEAHKWLRKAADQGNPGAEYWLASMYLDGQGVTKDYSEAAKLLKRSASQGYEEAQSGLASLYFTGKGVGKDYVEAYAWWNVAASSSTNAAAKRDILERLISSEQISEGQKRTKYLLAEVEVNKRNQAKRSQAKSIPPRVDENEARASGTGFFITTDGYMVSNEHVVKNAIRVRVVTGLGTISARVLKVDAANDLALLKAEGKFSPLPVTSSRFVKLGATVATVGFPNIGLQGFAPKLAKGEIASLSGAGDDARYFQISVPVQPGNSGGALVDERGNVVGVVSAKLDAATALKSSGALPENVNYAVKSSFLLGFLESVPEVAAKLAEPRTAERKFEDVVKDAEQAAVLVLVY